MFRVVLPPITRSVFNCIYSIWYLSHRYCYLPLSWKSWNRFECAVGGVLNTLHPLHYIDENRVLLVPGRDSSYPSGSEVGEHKQWFWCSLVTRKITLFLPGNKPNLSSRNQIVFWDIARQESLKRQSALNWIFFKYIFCDRASSYNSGKWPTWLTVSSIICLFESSTFFEQLCAHIQEDNCINTTSDIITLR
jgi:hypothetical protein